MALTVNECIARALELGIPDDEIFIVFGREHTVWHVYAGYCHNLPSLFSVEIAKWPFSGFKEWHLLTPLPKATSCSQSDNFDHLAICQCNRHDFLHNEGCLYMIAKHGAGWRPGP